MRIISGSHRGRRINPPMGLPVRPTTDMAKESLFNIFTTFLDYEELSVLDLFSGTGNMSYEFASRGCKEIIAIDNNIKCVSFISQVITDLKFSNIKVMKTDVFSFLFRNQRKFDVVFADPPYDLEHLSELPDRIINSSLKPEGWLILEHGPTNTFDNHPAYHHTRNYGKVHFSFFQAS